jgi:hypothetical protein
VVKALLKTQRNQVVRAAQAAGFDPLEFDWDDGGDDIRFHHPPSGAYFVFGGNAGNYVVRYKAGDEQEREVRKYTWDALMESVKVWLANAKQDIETPDIWDELWRQRALLRDVSDESFENTRFTPSEQDDIARRLNELREYVVTTYPLSESQLVELNSKLDYLVGAAGRVGRKDWLLLSFTVILSSLFGLALSPDVSRDIFEMLVRSIAHLFGHGFPLLGG